MVPDFKKQQMFIVLDSSPDQILLYYILETANFLTHVKSFIFNKTFVPNFLVIKTNLESTLQKNIFCENQSTVNDTFFKSKSVY